MKLIYLIGDATKPVKTPAIIAHVCNDIGAWGKGFVVPLGKKYPQAKKSYLKHKSVLHLNYTQILNFSNDVSVANMVAQKGIYAKNGRPPIRYDALEKCLSDVQSAAIAKNATVHMPRIGAGLAGGNWKEIEAVILKTMRVDTYVYTLDTELTKFPIHDKTIEKEEQ